MSGRACFLIFLLMASATAQLASDVSSRSHNVRVHVNFPNGGNCDMSTRVALVSSLSGSVARGAANRDCMVDLFDVPAGTYRLVVSGRDFANVDAGEVVVNSPWTESLEVNVGRPQTKRADDTELRSASTSVAGLRIPKKAAKEFDKANQLMEKLDWKAAIATLQKAIAIYPQYAAAYNNLGVSYARLGNRNGEAEALQHAISIDDHYVAAYLNLARMSIAAGAFPEAEADLEKAEALDPTNGVTLVLLAYAEYMDHHPDAAVANCKRVHAMQTVPHAFAHWVAAFAYEQKNQIAEAGAEFQLFIDEQPTGVRADAARKELLNIASYLSGKEQWMGPALGAGRTSPESKTPAH